MQPDIAANCPGLSTDERTLLNFVLSGPGRALDELAAACNTDILSLAEQLTSPRFQAALDTIRRAAAALTETRALACGQVALTALSSACENSTNPAESRRAAAALTRYLPKPTRDRVSHIDQDRVPPLAAGAVVMGTETDSESAVAQPHTETPDTTTSTTPEPDATPSAPNEPTETPIIAQIPCANSPATALISAAGTAHNHHATRARDRPPIAHAA